MHALLKKYHNKENGFTLVELLIVVLIIGILAAIAIPVYIGIQNQAHRSAIKADVNVKVKAVQVALTEGSTTAAQYGTAAGSEKGETVQVKASTTTGAGSNDFMVVGSEATPAGAINYTYTYDSVTGQFTDSDSGNIVAGGGAPPAAIGGPLSNPAIVYSKIYTTATLPTSGTTSLDSNESNFAVDSGNNVYYRCGYAICKVTPTGTISVFAGSTSGTPTDGPGATAIFGNIISMAMDSNDNLFVIERSNTLLKVRKLNTATNVVSTTATLTGFNSYNCNSGTQAAIGANNTLNIISIDSGTLQYTLLGVNADGTYTKTAFSNARGSCYYGTSLWVDGTTGTAYFTGYNTSASAEQIFKVAAGSPTATVLGNGGSTLTSITGSTGNGKLYSQAGNYITQNDLTTTGWTTNTGNSANVAAGNGTNPSGTATQATPGSVGALRWVVTAPSGRLYFMDNVGSSYWIRYLGN